MSRTSSHRRDRDEAARRRSRGTAPRIESLEDRSLLATSVFVAPNISDLIAAANRGQNTSQATINREISALQSQLRSGPLADLNSSTGTQAAFVSETNALVASFNQVVDGQLLPRYPNVDAQTKSQGARVQSNFLAQNASNPGGGGTTTPSTTFVAPNISGLLAAAARGQNTSVTTINTELTALRNQLTTAYNASTSLSQGSTAITGILTSFNQAIDAQIRPRFANVANIIELSSAKVAADLTSLQTKVAVGTVTPTDAINQGRVIVSTLNTGPLRAVGTTNQALVNRSQQFSSYLNTLGQALATTATNPLSIANVSTLTTAEGNAYLADMKASLYGRTNVTNILTANVTTLQKAVAAIAAGTGTGTGTVQAQYLAAVAAFNASQRNLALAIG